MIQQFHSWVYLKKKPTLIQKDYLQPDVQSSIIYNVQHMEAT